MSIFAPFSSISTPLDVDTIRFINASGLSGQREIFALNNLVFNLKNNGLWNKSNAIYPFIGGTADLHKWNLKDPRDSDAAFRLVFLGGMTHTSDGITGNGTSNFATTYLQVNGELAGGGGSSQNDNHMMYYGVSIAARNGICLGAGDGAQFQINARNGSDSFNTWNQNINLDALAGQTYTSGLVGMSRTNSADYVKFHNTTKTTVTRASSTPPSRDIFIMAQNGAGTAGSFQNRTMGLVSLGYGLTTTDIDNWVWINQAYQTQLGRFV